MPVNNPFMKPSTAALLPMPSAIVSISARTKPGVYTRVLHDCRISARSIFGEACSDSPLIDDGAAHDRVEHLGVEQPAGAVLPTSTRLVSKTATSASIPGVSVPLTVFFERRPRRALRVGVDRLFDGQPLIREPAVLRLALRASGASPRRRGRRPDSGSSARRWCPGCRCRRSARRRPPSACGTHRRPRDRSRPMRSSIHRMSSET